MDEAISGIYSSKESRSENLTLKNCIFTMSDVKADVCGPYVFKCLGRVIESASARADIINNEDVLIFYNFRVHDLKAKDLTMQGVERVRAWLYEGVEVTSAKQVTGSLVQVETGLQNDDYVQIVSGLAEGDVVLYTASETSSSSRFGGMMGGMGGMMGGMGGPRF